MAARTTTKGRKKSAKTRGTLLEWPPIAREVLRNALEHYRRKLASVTHEFAMASAVEYANAELSRRWPSIYPTANEAWLHAWETGALDVAIMVEIELMHQDTPRASVPGTAQRIADEIPKSRRKRKEKIKNRKQIERELVEYFTFTKQPIPPILGRQRRTPV